MVKPSSIAVLVESDDPARVRLSKALAARLGVALVRDRAESGADLFLAVTGDRLELRDSAPRSKGVFVDFTQLDPRTRAGKGSRDQPLIKAFGCDVHTLVDATAGLGQDAALLACMGYRVTAVERSPIIAALLEDGLHRAMSDDQLRARLKGHLTIVEGDAREVLRSISPPPDAVYIDPMFPPKRKKSALAPKSIRLVRAVVGPDEDVLELFHAAIHGARRRVIVKRPTDAPPLDGSPVMRYAGKLVRYDVYRVASRGENGP
jgi:16S rRNA (guanine1516-N2)-methyltransferase